MLNIQEVYEQIFYCRIPLSALAFAQYPYCRGTDAGNILQSTEKSQTISEVTVTCVYGFARFPKTRTMTIRRKIKSMHRSLRNETEDIFTSDLLQNFSDKETAFQVHQVLHRLSEPYKEVFSLRVFGELSFGTISSLFGKSESWARVTYHRACKKIREELDHEDQL